MKNLIPDLRTINRNLYEKNFSSENIEGLRNQAKDLLVWVLGDKHMVDAGNREISKLKTRKDVENYIDSMIDIEGKAKIEFKIPEGFIPAPIKN